jgi:uncharacterized membrane protein YagU involved in acid resistance
MMAILAGGLLCGVLDITAAFLTWAPYGVTPERVLQSVASGALGRRSFEGGWETAALGALFHFTIAFVAASVFYFASLGIATLTERPILSGIAYGVCVYAVMYWVVVPLSRVTPRPFSLRNTVIAILTHIVCVGLPIATMVRRYRAAR